MECDQERDNLSTLHGWLDEVDGDGRSDRTPLPVASSGPRLISILDRSLLDYTIIGQQPGASDA